MEELSDKTPGKTLVLDMTGKDMRAVLAIPCLSTGTSVSTVNEGRTSEGGSRQVDGWLDGKCNRYS